MLYTILLLAVVSCLLTTGATAADDSTRSWSFLRSTSSSSSNTDTTTTSTSSIITTTPYDDLLKCMWNGTTVALCHSMSCHWCHSSFADICVTAEYATNLDGSVFSCEGTGGNDDDAITPPTPSPTTDSPTPAPDDVLPIDDDGDPNHDANDKYEQKLLHCLALDENCASENTCTWCTFPGGGMCFSKQAAHQMDGGYYHCGAAAAAAAAGIESMNERMEDEEEAILMTLSID
eukprot:CAMPEP_0119004492 /NCGR_PEP_ID=MMETSP1176-20130426/1169_1 /TAXON_ID=265551 /ORGANISM="Synedropsis recta cf, Strain CCMP1620" /LENGTH=232 /DNA_ID=CAMNT_0006956199 /DNA_START=172 /DNA_END=870 /DNA_ORIENTATION=-